MNKQPFYKLALIAFLGLGVFTNAQVAEGTVGINTESPNATLDIVTKQGADKSLRVQNTSNAETVTVLNNGKVGIGTSKPTEKLDVNGIVKSNYAVNISRDGYDAGPYLQLENPLKTATGLGKQWRIYNMTGVYANSLQFWAYNDKENLGSKMILTDKGNLGLGVPNTYEPTNTLELRGEDVSLTSKNAPLMIGQYESANLAIDNNEIMARRNGKAATLYLNLDGGDVIVNSNARGGFYFREGTGLGVDVERPTAKLDVNGNVRIRSIAKGNPKTDQVLLADNEGNIKKVAAYQGSTSVVLKENSFERAALTGDVASAQNSNALKVTGIQNRLVAETAPKNGQVLKWNGSKWAPAQDNERFLKKDFDYVAKHTEFICDFAHEGKSLISLDGYFTCSSGAFIYTGRAFYTSKARISGTVYQSDLSSQEYVINKILYLKGEEDSREVESLLVNGTAEYFWITESGQQLPNESPRGPRNIFKIAIMIKEPTNW